MQGIFKIKCILRFLALAMRNISKFSNQNLDSRSPSLLGDSSFL